MVISLIGMIGASASPFLSRFVLSNQHQVVSDRLIGMLRKAQANSMTSRLGQNWGVCILGGNYIVYEGSCAAPNTWETYIPATSVSISGLSDVSFNRRGEPSADQSISVSTSVENFTITVNSAGRIVK